jgi:Ion channel
MTTRLVYRTRADSTEIDTATQDRLALVMMVSLLLFPLVGAFVTHDRKGEIVLTIVLCVALGAAAVHLSAKWTMRWPGIVLASSTAIVLLLSTFRPVRPLVATASALVTVSFGFIATNLFLYLGRPGQITNGRLYASVSLYLMIATVYYAVFTLIETINPGSFSERGLPAGSPVPKHSLLYFSLVTLTTLGYGDIVPVSREARAFAAFESVTGVLYIAITMARLVAAYRTADRG